MSRTCAACVMLAVLATRGIVTATNTTSTWGIAAPLTPRPIAARQLGPPSPSPLPTTASSGSGQDEEDRRAKAEESRSEEGLEKSRSEEGQEKSQNVEQESEGLLQTIGTQVRLFLACVPRWGPMSCFKLEALLVLHGESGNTVEGFIDGPDSESRRGSFFDELSEQPDVRDAYLNKMLIQALEDLLQDTLGLSKRQSERGMRRRRRWPNPLLAVMFGLGALIVVGGIAKTAMIAGKALALSMLALALAVMMGLRGGGGGGGGGGAANYEVLGLGVRRRAGVTAPAQYPTAVYIDASSEQPSGIGSQSLAYSGHHTRP